MIYEGSMEVYAPSGIGKTWFMLELCISIASGKKILIGLKSLIQDLFSI